MCFVRWWCWVRWLSSMLILTPDNWPQSWEARRSTAMRAGSHTALYVHIHNINLLIWLPFCSYISKFAYYYIDLCVFICTWLSAQAIEAFALMVKTTAQTLQAFGTELAETELPNDAEATISLLHTHTLKKDKMKVRHASLSFLYMLSNHMSLCPSHLCLVDIWMVFWRWPQ